jgi:hypothetical protein
VTLFIVRIGLLRHIGERLGRGVSHVLLVILIVPPFAPG